MKETPTRTKKASASSRSPEVEAARFASRVVVTPPSLEDILVEDATAWEALLESVKAQQSAEDRVLLDADARAELETRIQQALPAGARRDVMLLSDANGLNTVVEREAAYLAGVAVGRLLGHSRQGA